MGKHGSAAASRERLAFALVSIPGAPCAEDVEVSLPPLSELQAITDIVELRKRAGELGMVLRVLQPDGQEMSWRRKADILDDYKRKLDESAAWIEAAKEQPSLPPLSELQAITDMVEFRIKAKDLGMEVCVFKPDVRCWGDRP